MQRGPIITMLAASLLGGVCYSAEDGGGGPPQRSLPPAGQVDKGSNGQPTPGKVDSAAVAELERLEALFQEDGHEKEVAEGALQLVGAFEQTEDYDHLVDCVFLIGEAAYALGDWARAEEYMSRANNLGQRYFPDGMSSYPLKVIGDCRFEQGKVDGALKAYQERVTRLRKEGPADELAGALFDAASAHMQLGQLSQAKLLFSEARESNAAAQAALPADAEPGEVDGRLIDAGEILYHLGMIAATQEDVPAARSLMEDALRAFESASPAAQEEFSDRLAALLGDLLRACEELGDKAAAEQYRKQRDEWNK